MKSAVSGPRCLLPSMKAVPPPTENWKRLSNCASTSNWTGYMFWARRGKGCCSPKRSARMSRVRSWRSRRVRCRSSRRWERSTPTNPSGWRRQPRRRGCTACPRWHPSTSMAAWPTPWRTTGPSVPRSTFHSILTMLATKAFSAATPAGTWSNCSNCPTSRA